MYFSVKLQLVKGDEWKAEPVEAYVLVYSIDRKSSFRAVTNVLEDLRRENNNVPVILCANKIDLERKRAVMSGGKSIRCIN
jgi:GTPase Era involved in 16S rRNA processing